MNKQKKANIICIIIAIVIIIAGAIFGYIKGFNIELMYSNRQEIVLTHNATLDINKVKEIASSVLENKKVKVQKVGRFENSVQIISTEISDEEKQNIIKDKRYYKTIYNTRSSNFYNNFIIFYNYI